MKTPHIPVLLDEVKNVFSDIENGYIIDCTLGYGGHSEALLELNENSRLICVDQDKEAIEFSKKRLKRFSERIIFENDKFSNIIQKYKDKNNIIEYNYWGNYAGFDKDNDNIGDTPYVVYQYADKLWDYNPHIKFFFGSIVMSLANFLCKVAPFTEPIVLLTDKKPLIKKVSLPKN